MSWKLYDASALLSDFSGQWQQLNSECNGGNPMLDIKFVGPLLKHFSDGEQVLLAVERQADVLQSMLLLQAESFGRWKLFMPSQAAVGPLIMRDRSDERLLESLRGLCRVLPGYVWQIGFQKQDPLCSALRYLERLPQVLTTGHVPTTFVNVNGEFDQFWSVRPKGIRQNVNKSLRALKSDGVNFYLNTVSSPESIAEALGQYADVESSGWKGKNGTAIKRTNRQGGFYREVLMNFAEPGNCRVYQLFLGDNLVASLLTVVQNGMQVVLKTTFDENFAHYSPGRLADYLMLQSAFQDPLVQVVENYTDASPEDQKWTSGCRHIYHVNYFRQLLYCRAFKALKIVRR